MRRIWVAIVQIIGHHFFIFQPLIDVSTISVCRNFEDGCEYVQDDAEKITLFLMGNLMLTEFSDSS